MQKQQGHPVSRMEKDTAPTFLPMSTGASTGAVPLTCIGCTRCYQRDKSSGNRLSK